MTAVATRAKSRVTSRRWTSCRPFPCGPRAQSLSCSRRRNSISRTTGKRTMRRLLMDQ
uniref:Uncharacterized protein n=1 Tax=Hyaloperonospora arabidopsidis (strain Emoy2) TaxID=559515 RepID=M4BRN7_HYAAE